MLSFISGYVKFENPENSRNFGDKIYKMVEYETTEELLENFFNLEKRIRTLEKWLKENQEELQEIKQIAEQARLAT